ncbi:MAG: bifunctional serine/threonine-protein kinase/formylglycine-generating enzyme family protein [Gemmatales bacterium]
MLCPLCKTELPKDTVVEGSGARKCNSCGATLDQYFEATESVVLEKLGRFTLLHTLGEGGFGTVYKAKDATLERTVAIKILHTKKMGSADREEHLIREAKAACHLNHPGIVKVYDLEDEGPIKVLVEEYVEGDTLDQLILKKKLSLQEQVSLIAKIADALGYAHKNEVVHRDIKPANIMVDAFGQPRILDFGLAKREGIDDSITQEGQLVGTIVYMSPEQANGHVSMIRGPSDQYSLGVILFQMITGELPFRGAGNMVLRQIVLDEPPAPRSLNDSIPRDLENICLKTLSKKIGDRYESTDKFAADLRRYLNNEPVEARPVGVAGKLQRWARRNRTLATSLASIAAILIIATLVSLYFAVKSFNDLQARIAAEKAEKQSQLKLLLDGDPAEVRPVIITFRQNLPEYEPELRTMQNDPSLDVRKQARVLLALCEKDPELEEKLYQLFQYLPTPEALLANELLKQGPSPEREQQLWSTLKNRQAIPAQRLNAAVILAKTKPQNPQWTTMASSVVEDLLNPAYTLFLPLWVQHLKPIWPRLQEPLALECSKKTDVQRATLATTIFIQLYGQDTAAIATLLGRVPIAIAPLLMEHLKNLKQPTEVIQAELRKVAGPGAERSSLITVPNNLPAPSDALQKKMEASSGLIQPTFAICAALRWPDVAAVMKDMTAASYRPVRFRPYPTATGLHAAVIWHRDYQPGSPTPLWDFAIDLSAAELEAKAAKAKSDGWQPIEVSAYDVERRAGVIEVRYAWISVPGIPKPLFQVKLDVPEKSFLETSQQWLFGVKAVYHPGGILDLEKGSLPVSLSTRGNQPGQASFTYVLNTIPPQRGTDSCSPSFALALSEDKFRLTQADFNIHHDIAWVTPPAATTRLNYFKQMRENAVRLLKSPNKNLNAFTLELIQDRTCALYEIGDDPEWVTFLRQQARNEQLSVDTDLLMSLYWARAGEKELAQLCSNRFVERKSSDLRQAVFLNSAVQLLLSKAKALPAAIDNLEKLTKAHDDNFSRFLLARLFCLAADAVGLDTPQGKQWLDRAWQLAQQVIQEGEGLGYELDRFWSRDFAPLAEKLEPLLQRKRQSLRYCTTWSPSRGLDQRLHYGETADLALPLWQNWLAEGFVPHTISVIEWQGKPRLLSAWRRVRPTPEQDAAVANRRANVQLALAQLGHTSDAWKSMETTSLSNVDVELANELMFRSAPYKLSAATLIARLREPCTPLMKQRLLIALGQYTLEDCGPAQKELLPLLTQWLLNDPDPGVHSTCDWLLRTWKQQAAIEAAWKGQNRTLEKRENRLWFKSPRGQEMVIFPKSPSFYMGLSVDDNEASVPYRERPHQCRIGHAFALATKEVTQREFFEFNPLHDSGDYRFARTQDCPIGQVRWSDAAYYCNWLSKKEKIPEEQWCYLVKEAINEKTREKIIEVYTAPDYLERTGYRLSLESEFEYASRGNSRLIRFFGNSTSRISNYAWYDNNSERQFHPVGTRVPNNFGIFDIYGNASELLNDVYFNYPPTLGTEIVQDHARQLSPRWRLSSSDAVAFRSFSWAADPNFIRTSQRSGRSANAPSNFVDLGFRVARTVNIPN